jgi:putative FmdB family regulatory protein
MPLYEYRCAKCGNIVEVLEKADAGGRHTCEKCGSRRMAKLISTFGVGAGARSSGDSCPTGTCPLS